MRIAETVDTDIRPRKTKTESADLDITPMIDITFLLLIFFLVASVQDPNSAVDLPMARHGIGVTEQSSVFLTVVDGGLGIAGVYLAENKVLSERCSDVADEQREQIRSAVAEGYREGRSNVLIKAESGVAHREVARVAAIASSVSGVKLHVAVLEDD